MNVLIISTDPRSNTNGYSKVMYNLMPCFCKLFKKVHVFATQTNKDNIDITRINEDAIYYDVDMSKTDGFGFEYVYDYVENNNIDVVFIYNDPFICSCYIQKIFTLQTKSNIKIWLYLDITSPIVKDTYINIFNKYVDIIYVFEKCWKNILCINGSNVKCKVIQHGCSMDTTKILEKPWADDKWVLLNLNRNTYRKRLDLTIKAFCFVLQYNTNVILLLKESSVFDTWNLRNIFDTEMQFIYKTNVFEYDKYVVQLKEKLSDKEVNMIYNISHIGLNSSEGEGFGLCNYEHHTLHKPQIVPNIHPFTNMYAYNTCVFTNIAYTYYIENSRDAIGGIANVIDYYHFAVNIIKLIDINTYNNYVYNIKQWCLSNNTDWEFIGNNMIEYMKCEIST